MNSDSLWYSTSITVQFKGRTIELPAGNTSASTSDIIKPNTRNILQSVKQKYGNFRLEKVFKNSSWEDTLSVDRNTGRQVKLRNLSQFYKIIFNEMICVDSLITELNVFPEIVSADRPSIVTLHYVPSDYSPTEQWSLDRIGATRAWDITNGNDQVKIAVVDFFETTDPNLHNELQGKISYNPDNLSKKHGQIVAGAIAAHTDNNGEGIASIGFNSKVMLFQGNTASAVEAALLENPEIINCSWGQVPNAALDSVFYNALKQGVIVVASAGNGLQDMGSIPQVEYPAAYNFKDILPGIDRQVIAVSATMLENDEEVFAHDANGRWNYSPQDNPGVFPEQAFIDFSAPGVDIKVLHPTIQNQYTRVSGTSLSAPIVAGTIALMKSVNPSLTPEATFEILKNTAEKIGADPYNYQIPGGWNQYMGYGRINAHNAVNVASGAPYPPKNLYVTTSSTVGIFSGTFSAEAQLNWLANSEPDLDYYKIYKAATTEDSEPAYDDYNLIATSQTNSATVSVNDFGDNKRIYYRITAIDTEGKESLLSQSESEWAPPTPPSINITPTSDGHPKIYWNMTPGMTYAVYRKIESESKWGFSSYTQIASGLTQDYYTDSTIDWDGTHVQNELDVYYKVTKRRNENLISNFSNIKKAWIEGDPQTKEGSNNEELPKVYAMEQNFPNPFNPSTQIKYQLPKDSHVVIKLYDMLGRELQEILNMSQQAGYHELRFDGRSLPSGMYIYKIAAGEFTDSKKMLLIK